MRYALAPKQRLHGPNDDAKHSKPENSVLNPGSGEMDYANILNWLDWGGKFDRSFGRLLRFRRDSGWHQTSGL